MPNLGQREPQPAGLTHERQQPQHVRVVVAVAGRRAPWRLENLSCFVQPARLAAEAATRSEPPLEVLLLFLEALDLGAQPSEFDAERVVARQPFLSPVRDRPVSASPPW